VASNSPRALLDLALRCAGFGATIPVSVAAEEVPSPKPAPDLYLRACWMLGVPPGRALAFEDSPTGLRSAAAAGLRTVGVPGLAGLELAADLVVPSLADPRLLGWVGTW
jgi:beta-phosphoglucomutase-like phosphatase (HAD superfamily)